MTAVAVAAFAADQRTRYGVPHAVSCRALQLSESWCYKWRSRSRPERPATSRQQRRADLDAAVKKVLDGSEQTYGSPRVHLELVDAGWSVSVNRC